MMSSSCPDMNEARGALKRLFSFISMREMEIERFGKPVMAPIDIDDINAATQNGPNILVSSITWLSQPMQLMEVCRGDELKAVFQHHFRLGHESKPAEFRLSFDQVELMRRSLELFRERAVPRWNLIQLYAALSFKELANRRGGVDYRLIESFQDNRLQFENGIREWRPELLTLD